MDTVVMVGGGVLGWIWVSGRAAGPELALALRARQPVNDELYHRSRSGPACRS